MSNVMAETDKNPSGQEFFTVSIKKLCIMYIFTFGLYSLVFFYKNWALQKYRYNLSILPALRSILYIFFTHSLFKRIRMVADKSGIEGVHGFGWLATVFVFLNIVSSFISMFSPEHSTLTIYDKIYMALLLLSLLPLIPVQKTVLRINNEPDGVSNSKFTIYNWIFIVMGGMVWAALVVLFFMPAHLK